MHAETDHLAGLCARLRARVVRNRVHWADSLDWPTATEEQVCAAEEEVGFALPPFLRDLYMQVANGYFAVGLDTLTCWPEGACPTPFMRRVKRKTLGQMVSHSGWRLHPRVEEALRHHRGYYVISTDCPDRFLTVGGGATGLESIAVDGWTGAVYLVGMGGKGALRTGEGAILPLYSIEFAAPSLEEFFAHWLDGFDYLAASYQGELQPEWVEVADSEELNTVWGNLYHITPRSGEVEYALPGVLTGNDEVSPDDYAGNYGEYETSESACLMHVYIMAGDG